MTDNGDSLCIIGHEKSRTDLALLEQAKKKFSSVFYVPVDGTSIGLTDKFTINYRIADLQKYRVVFPRIPKELSSFAYQLLSLFPENTYMPIKPISFLLAEERFFLITVLRKKGISTPDLHMARSAKAAHNILECIDFPVIVRPMDKKTGVYVKNKSEAKGVIDALGSLHQVILIEQPISNIISVFVSGQEILASVKRATSEKDLVFAKGKIRSQKIGLETRQLALDAASAVGAQICRVDISAMKKEPAVVNINLNPELMIPSKVTKVNLPEKIMDTVFEGYKQHEEKPMLMRFFEDAKTVVKDVLKSDGKM